ncbi:MAG TPA: CPBP family intramembrane glutamic endopeptidase [Pirellulales bacterium]|nr:CPBP family intramembrane glutamic endopeptidase [Pirellulales bacterium]
MIGPSIPDHRYDWPLLLFALLYPALLTWVYFLLLAEAAKSTQQTVYVLGKAIQFGLPLVWVGWICREPLHWPKFSTRGLLAGIVFGLVFGGAAVAIYFGALKSAGWFDEAAGKMSGRLAEIGINNPAEYAGVALFYSLVHSLLEEYYWRWFVFGQLRRRISLPAAIAISSVAFMGHHVIVLGIYFGWASPWTYSFSLATALGGAFWAWLYQRSGSIYGPWFSHLLLDAAIFGVGYDLMHTAELSH